jgi:hypothetical protein
MASVSLYIVEARGLERGGRFREKYSLKATNYGIYCDLVAREVLYTYNYRVSKGIVEKRDIKLND